MKSEWKELEILLPFKDYNRIEGKKESCVKVLIFVTVALTIEICMFYYLNLLQTEKISDFILDYIGSEIDIVALLLSFSIAYLTILITSNTHNIERLKEHKTQNIIDNKRISLYQKLLIQLTYTIYNEMVLLILLLIHKFTFPLFTNLLNIVFFTVNIILLLNIMYVIFKNVKNIYLSFWKDNN